MSRLKSKLIVAAIDFGTTYSGYAYSFQGEFQRDPLKIYANQNWNDDSNLLSSKAPTVVLFDRDGKFNSFGYDAEEKYALLSEGNQHKGWKYFKHFKMKLNDLNLRRRMTLIDDQEGRMPAIDVFSAAIRYLKDHLMKRLQERLNNKVYETDIHWVLTIPAIWQDGAKQFMKEAAVHAGIPEDQLTLALEPEAAAIYCKEVFVARSNEDTTEAKFKNFDPGSHFIVLDIGGGTVDITVHEVQRDGTLKELYSPSGGPWGGTVVDKEIYQFLDLLFDQSVMRRFRDELKTDDLDLQRKIELKKRRFKNEGDKVCLNFPRKIYELFEEEKNTSFEKALPKSKLAAFVTKKHDRLHISNEKFLDMFNLAKDSLIKHVEKLLREPVLENVKTILMVGGFSESKIIRDAVKDAFSTMNVIIPEEAGLAVVKGAVMFGHNPECIISRQLPYTYGISTSVPFDGENHLDSKKVFRDGMYKCEEVFKVFIKAGTTVVPHETKVEYKFRAPFIADSTATLEIYRSEKPNPKYISDDGCWKIGEVSITFSSGPRKEKQIIDVEMMFGFTELSVTAKQQDTNNQVTAKFNFLS